MRVTANPPTRYPSRLHSVAEAAQKKPQLRRLQFGSYIASVARPIQDHSPINDRRDVRNASRHEQRERLCRLPVEAKRGSKPHQ